MSTSHAPSHDPRWRRLPEERPQQILDAALSVFAEHGIDAAKLEDIAARAGVSKGTIYLYFPSKEELFREVLISAGQASGRRLRLLEVRGQAFDHPSLLAMPETKYLKCFVLEAA